MLGGQKLQGYLTASEIHEFLKARGRENAYPLFRVVVSNIDFRKLSKLIIYDIVRHRARGLPARPANTGATIMKRIDLISSA